MQPMPVAGPSRLPYNDDSGLQPRAKKRRRCNCHQSTRVAVAFALTASLFPAVEAGDAHARKRDTSLADHYIQQDDGSWVESTDWQLNGKSAQQQVGGGVVNDFAAIPSSSVSDAPIPTATSSTPTSETPSSAPQLSVPDAWTTDPRTSFYAVPIIVVMSVLLAAIIVILIIVIVVMRQRRRKRGKELRSEDPELVEDEKSVKPTTRRGRMSAAVRQRTAGLRRRGKKRKMTLTRQVEDDDSGASARLAEEDVTEAVVSPSQTPSLMRQVSRDARSIVSVSTRAGADDDDDDANSVTALTVSASADRPMRSLQAQNPTTVFFQQPAQHRRSAVSLASVELPSAPPAYPSSSSRTQPQAASSSRRDQKRRMTQEELDSLDNDEAPPQHEDDVLPPPPVDTTGFVGHVAIDEKAALARLADMSSAPEGSSSHVEHTAPDADAIEQAMVDEVLEDAIAEPEQPRSLLPAPSRPVVTGFRVPRPSAPPTVTISEPSAPPLPYYEPSAPEYEAEREEHIEV